MVEEDPAPPPPPADDPPPPPGIGGMSEVIIDPLTMGNESGGFDFPEPSPPPSPPPEPLFVGDVGGGGADLGQLKAQVDGIRAELDGFKVEIQQFILDNLATVRDEIVYALGGTPQGVPVGSIAFEGV